MQGVSGNLALEGTSRLAAVKTVSGGITITNGGADAQLSLSTINGDLLVQTLNTRALDVNTVTATSASADGQATARTQALDGNLDLQTSLVRADATNSSRTRATSTCRSRSNRVSSSRRTPSAAASASTSRSKRRTDSR